MTPIEKSTTLFGGRNLTVAFEPADAELADPDFSPRTAIIKVRQIPVRDYEAGFACFEDEPALVSFLCGQPKAWAASLTPESYEQVLTTGREVNARGFFSFCQRHTAALEEKRNKAVMIGLAAVKNLPPELLARVMPALTTSPSPTSSPEFAPRPKA